MHCSANHREGTNTLTPARREAFRRLLDSQTHNVVDQYRSLFALKAANPDELPEVKRMILDRRAAWLNWLTVTQRKWQSKTRNPNKANHHDSIAAREKYVRC